MTTRSPHHPAGAGLGRQHALLLASRGALVVVNDIGGALDGTGSSDDPASLVVKEIAGAGGIAVADSHNIATSEGWRGRARHRHGSVRTGRPRGQQRGHSA